ncbi:hypothetical protein EKO04_001725 [Ascochyta lentis]|uniref:Chromo domain-containing protein n=1 Tax=Ascochyta lentis TaxID=205686 RepID=A0A8H7MH74_9PLEO|nr:hypothetical protein EKO04_001725 [Ascochyta lentis]
MVQKFAETIDFVKAQMAEAQQVGDKVWLKLGNQFSNGRASRKLDWKNRKFTVVEVISPHNVKLDVDGKVHPVFHVDRLKLCLQDPLHGQSNDDPQPGPLVITNDDGTSSEEWKVDSICGERRSRRGGKRREYLVQWEGHVSKTWEREDVCEDLEALDRWLSATRDRRDRNGNLPPGFQLEPPEGHN